jgi:hypothetical protein
MDLNPRILVSIETYFGKNCMILSIIETDEPLILDLCRITHRTIPSFVWNQLWIKNYILWRDEEHSSVCFVFSALIWFDWKIFKFLCFCHFWSILVLVYFVGLFLSWLGLVNLTELTWPFQLGRVCLTDQPRPQ